MCCGSTGLVTAIRWQHWQPALLACSAPRPQSPPPFPVVFGCLGIDRSSVLTLHIINILMYARLLSAGDSYKGGSSYSDIRFARVVVEVQDFLTRDRCRGKQPAASRAFTLGLPGSSAVPVTANVIAAADAVVSSCQYSV